MARDKEGHFIMIEGSGGYPICLQLHTQRALRYTEQKLIEPFALPLILGNR